MSQTAQLSRLGLFDARVPRYTSYPTAPQFSASVAEPQVRDWIAAIPAGAAVSLYVHVPFCRHLCWFCACRTQGTQRLETVRAYLDTLLEEIRRLRAILPAGVRLSRLHWGGGTPTLMDPAMIATLAGAIAEMAPFAPGAEFSVEIDPNEIDAPRMAALAAAGMNRASVGVQDFDPAIQKTIGRIQSVETTARAIEMIRAAGVHSLNADILYGLPDQSPARIAASVERLLALAPDRVALYGYAHVPWMARRQAMIPSDRLPTPEERLRLFETARDLFAAAGYREIGIDHFALPSDSLAIAARNGRLRRNFQGYTEDPAEVLIGIGASSISRFPQGYAQNAGSTSDYTAHVRAGRFPVARGHVFSAEDRVRARLIEALMCDFAVDLSAVLHPGGPDAAEVRGWMAAAAARFAGFVTLENDRLAILPEGRPLARMVARSFDAYAMAATGHSSAV
ncbi:oxygen-independent coproporphyrinogen III oxidase [Mangrovicoccus algicola]|uniref:Coproporphyrinogen-III oxidase n=1 Tax=Mangrovicoccus algicola TaxID=2771008 RepID=A0A8J6Z4L2_9RHOB|nr:oxygen-independent coproporphyrinogen III oxidase [Mangrovicoccus algicola]MBE3637524.1 oxygen-independent coproporphyrinogen III oxidase [Mangrovicoccus algicola]